MNTDTDARPPEFVLTCPELEQRLIFFTEKLGFRVEMIFPADDPRVVVISGYGLRLRLQRGKPVPAGVLRLLCRDPQALAEAKQRLISPAGIRIELLALEPPPRSPPRRDAPLISGSRESPQWKIGRAGMFYRDLIPGHMGGRCIASHIRIPEGGPVPDYVHFHHVRFQMIYCYKGWVRVVYEDQGPPFVMRAGDSVLQPPRIRHRVLECAPGLEVIEIGCPAEHETHADHHMRLPTPVVRQERDFDGQRFVRHQAARAPWRSRGFEFRDLGIEAASNGLASARVIRPAHPSIATGAKRDTVHIFLFVLAGRVSLNLEGAKPHAMNAGDCCVTPVRVLHDLRDQSDDLELLEVSLPDQESQ